MSIIMILNGYFEKQLLPVNKVYNYPKCCNSSLETLRRKGRQTAFSADLHGCRYNPVSRSAPLEFPGSRKQQIFANVILRNSSVLVFDPDIFGKEDYDVYFKIAH